MSTRALPAEPGYELEAGVHTIGPLKRGLPMGGYSRAYLVEEGDRLTLIDTLFMDDAQFIIDYLWSIGKTPNDLTDIILTHSHRSHIGGAARLRSLSNARVSCHASEARIVEGKESMPPVKLLPLRPPQLIPFRVLSHLHMPKHRPCVVDEVIDETSTCFGALEVIHVPGHTPGSLALRWKQDTLFVADAVLTWPRFGAGWPGFNLDEPRFRQSLKRLVDMRPRVLGPGHGLPICEHTAERIEALVTQPAA
jgi:glyoxylase-like metal-dependent hydrolase (beta-lactamase superfamily II)